MAFARSMTLDELADRLDAGANALPGAVPTFLAAAAIECSSELKRGINAGTSPDGSPFKPLAFPRAGGGSQPLRDKGLLLASLGGGPNFIQRVTGDGLTLGTNVAYARVQQDGATITAPSGKALAIPLTREASRIKSPRDFPRPLEMRWPKGKSKGVLVEKKEKGRGKKKKTVEVAQYALVKRVKIPPRPFVGISAALKAKLEKLAVKIFGEATGLTK